MKMPRLPLALALLLGVPLFSVATAQNEQEGAQRVAALKNGTANGSSPLVDKVRRATSRFKDINVAIDDGWVPATPCVSGPNEGAMGVHFGLPDRIGDGVINANEPELLIYEPMANGAMRLVGVEFIVIAKDWADKNPDGGAPNVDGHLMNFVGEPNRYGLPAFYEMHVWAWENNPNGNFADWNTRVTCNKQPAP